MLDPRTRNQDCQERGKPNTYRPGTCLQPTQTGVVALVQEIRELLFPEDAEFREQLLDIPVRSATVRNVLDFLAVSQHLVFSHPPVLRPPACYA